METSSAWVTCDGCGLPASPAHIAERVGRLELATRFRPIHVNMLFVAFAPALHPEDDFYRPPDSREFFEPFMKSLDILASADKSGPGADTSESDTARLLEFQRRGYYLSYLSECPIPVQDEDIGEAISRLGPTLIRRIRFNYKPKHIAILSRDLSPLRDVFEKAGMSSALFQVLDASNLGNAASAAQFRAALGDVAPHENLASEYDRIRVKHP